MEGMDPHTQRLFVEAGKAIAASATEPVKRAGVKVLAAFKGYEPYLKETYRKVSTFRSLLNPNQNLATIEKYVPATFQCPDNKLPDCSLEELISSLHNSQKVVVSCFAGCGKSMAMKYIALSLYENPSGKIPLFIELRSLNRLESPNLLAFINATYAQGSAVSLEAFRQGLEAGVFVILLDGFDEINHDIRHQIETQILDLAVKYPNNSIVVSGRPHDNRYSSWGDFRLLKMNPMSKLQTVELIDKLDYDPGVKRRFLQKLRGGLYESHQSFMSTPLLALLMLLTFQKNSNIPDKMYLFYGKAYETLFNQHDAIKEQYDRTRKSKLQIDEFQDVFSTFCLTTYVAQKTEFTQTEIVKALRDALKYRGQSADVNDVLFDLEESICMIVNEGNAYFFIHRSFQEYFTAVFLSSCPEEDRDKFLDNVAPRHWDQVLPMLFDMAGDQIEASWLPKKLEHFLSAVGTEHGKMAPLDALWENLIFQRRGDQGTLMHLTSGPFRGFMSTIGRFYPEAALSGVLKDAILDSYILENWNELPFLTEEKYEVGGGTFVEREIPLKALPADILEDCGLAPMVNKAFNQMKRIDRRLAKSRRAREGFLDTFLTPGPGKEII